MPKLDYAQLASNWQHSGENIYFLWKLYSSIFSKCRYTSLELAVRAAVLMADHIANFRTDNPVKVGSSDRNQEQCHRFWQCQTIVDS